MSLLDMTDKIFKDQQKVYGLDWSFKSSVQVSESSIQKYIARCCVKIQYLVLINVIYKV